MRVPALRISSRPPVPSSLCALRARRIFPTRAFASTRPLRAPMAGTRFSYVKSFEQPDALLPETYMVLRLDGHGFHKFSDAHAFAKPNDARALRLMDAAAAAVMDEFRDVVLAFGESDEFSFLLRKKCTLYNRRQRHAARS